MKRQISWRIPQENEIPEGDLLVAVKTNKGVDVALVYIDDDGLTLVDTEYNDVWTAWNWKDVDCYVPIKEVLPSDLIGD